MRLSLALIALGLSIWIVVPGPAMLFVVLSVVGTELWPVYMILDAIVLALALHSRRVTRPITITAAVAALLCTFAPLLAYLVNGPHVPLQAFFMPLARASALDVVPNAPVVLTIYGGAWEGGSPENNRRLDAIIASWGYHVIELNYPHAPQARWPAQREAILRQIDALHVKHVTILGHSSGAQLAMIAAALRPRRISALVTYESPSDIALPFDSAPLQPQTVWAREIVSDLCGGTPDQRPACYRSASPKYIVHAGMPPTLMISAGRDQYVSIRSQHLLRDELRGYGVNVTYIELPWANHGFETIANGFDNRIVLWYLHRFLDIHARS